jgi:hypothetical protein
MLKILKGAVRCRVTVGGLRSHVWCWCAAVGYCSVVTCSAACGGWVALRVYGSQSTCAVRERRYSGDWVVRCCSVAQGEFWWRTKRRTVLLRWRGGCCITGYRLRGERRGGVQPWETTVALQFWVVNLSRAFAAFFLLRRRGLFGCSTWWEFLFQCTDRFKISHKEMPARNDKNFLKINLLKISYNPHIRVICVL